MNIKIEIKEIEIDVAPTTAIAEAEAMHAAGWRVEYNYLDRSYDLMRGGELLFRARTLDEIDSHLASSGHAEGVAVPLYYMFKDRSTTLLVVAKQFTKDAVDHATALGIRIERVLWMPMPSGGWDGVAREAVVALLEGATWNIVVGSGNSDPDEAILSTEYYFGTGDETGGGLYYFG